MEDIKRKTKPLICSYCFLDVSSIEDLIDHMQGRHDFSSDLNEKSFIERLKRVGWNV